MCTDKFTLIVLAFLATLFSLFATGCNDPLFPDQAQIRIKYSPLGGFSYLDTKDNNIKAKGRYNPETGEVEFETEVVSNASDVNAGMVSWMQEFREQMKERNEQDRITGQNIALALQGINELGKTVGSAVTQLGQIVADTMNVKTKDFEAGNKATTPMTKVAE